MIMAIVTICVNDYMIGIPYGPYGLICKCVKWNEKKCILEPVDGYDPKDVKKSKGQQSKATVHQIVDLLKDGDLTTGEWQKKANEEFDIARSTFNEKKRVAKERGLIVHAADGKHWTINTKKGEG